jgi:tetratricopeptide (TPR) repeat protein
MKKTVKKVGRHLSKLHKVSLAVLFIILLTGVALLSLHFLDKQSENRPNNEVVEVNLSGPSKQELVLKQFSYEELRKKTNLMRIADQNDEAIELIKFQDDAYTTFDKSILLVLFLQEENMQEEALTVLRKLESSNSSSKAVIRNIAITAEQSNNNELAIEYYNKLIEVILNNDTPSDDFDADVIKNKIAELQE